MEGKRKGGDDTHMQPETFVLHSGRKEGAMAYGTKAMVTIR